MKTKIYLLIIAVLFLSTWMVNNGWSQNEPVNGYYDSVNDWFVFEWERPNYGKTMTIYDPPHKVKPLINAELIFDEKNREYKYAYEVTNQVGAKQHLEGILIKHLTEIYAATSPEPSAYWSMGEYRDKSAWEWAKVGGEGEGILPNDTERGFSFKSTGLPIIVNVGFYGHERAIYSPPGDYDTDEVEDSFERVMKNLEKQYPEKFKYVVKRTLGPTAPPADFKPIEFITNIINIKHEASALGWITNKGIEQSLDAKLDNAKKKIEQGNIGAAKNILSAFINEVEAQGCAVYENCPQGKHLTPEAYALLKYNVQYLIGKL